MREEIDAMNRFTHIITTSILATGVYAQSSPDATPIYEIQSGYVSANDGTFNYQGYLEVDGEPANGMYSFRFEAFEDPEGNNLLSELHFFSPQIPVVDGLFNVDVQMGGDSPGAQSFWRSVGDREMYLEIGVGMFEGGPYTTLGTLSKVGWSARAQYAGIAESLRFPYTDIYTDPSADPTTMISLTSEFGGIVAEFRSNQVRDEPLVYIRGDEVFSPNFGFQSGALLVDSRDDEVGIRGEAARYSVVGFFSDVSTLPGVSAAVLGSVGFFSSPDVVAIWANNSASGNDARLGTENHAGEFYGDVLVNGNMRVEGEPVRDFGSNELSPIGPIAYGFVSSGGATSGATANLSSSWDAANSRYIISINGENYVNGPYTANVTVVDSNEPRLATTNAVGGDLVITIWDLNSGNARVQDNFQVVVYKPDPNAFILRGAPDGVDSDKYYEQTGSAPILGTTSQSIPVVSPQPPSIK